MKPQDQDILDRSIQVSETMQNRSYVCLYPGCNAEAIGSHSQWKRGTLSHIARSGKVYANKPSLEEAWKLHLKGRREANIVLQSISKSSTFPGFCQHHDNRLFRPIEKRGGLKPGSIRQIRSLYLRAVSYTLARKRFGLESLEVYASLCSNMRQIEYLNHETIRLREELDAFRKEIYLPLFDEGFKRTLSFCWCVIPECLPISNVSVVCPIPVGDQDKCCADSPEAYFAEFSFSVVPAVERTDVVMVWNREARPFMDRWVREFMHENPKRFERFLNRLVFNYSEDMCLNPDFWESLAPRTRQRIRCSLATTNRPSETLPTLLAVRLAEKSLVSLQRIRVEASE